MVPDAEVMPGWAKKRGFDGTYEELCRNKVGCCTCSAVTVLRWGDVPSLGKDHLLTEVRVMVGPAALSVVPVLKR